MKKRLEAELISIAHRVLKLKNKSEIDQLYLETQKLYEALTILKFYGDHYEQVKLDVASDDLEVKIAAFVEDRTIIENAKIGKIEATQTIVEDSPIEAEVSAIEEVTASEADKIENQEQPTIFGNTINEVNENKEEIVADLTNDLGFEPIFELASELPIEDVVVEKVTSASETSNRETKQISLEDLLGENYTEPVFVKPNDIVIPDSLKNVIDEKPLSLNDQHLKAINIGLNDKMGFVKNLFGDSNEDYNRVLSQLNSFSSFDEAKVFIDEIIKPDYNNWDGVDDYAEKFLEIVAKKFS
jgi:hypothetical protein